LEKVQLKDKEFRKFLAYEKEILPAIEKVAAQLNQDYKDKNPLFVVVLNGSFLFAADLIKRFNGACEVSFIKVKSYEGTSSTGDIKELLSIEEEIKDRHVLLIEDIVDTGNTLEYLINSVKVKNPASLKIITLLFKPEAYKKQMKVDYVGMEIENKFVVGFGLDYDGLGRNLKDIYVLN
jgi:hypoxanthine phosphoribosyltransferase